MATRDREPTAQPYALIGEGLASAQDDIRQFEWVSALALGQVISNAEDRAAHMGRKRDIKAGIYRNQAYTVELVALNKLLSADIRPYFVHSANKIISDSRGEEDARIGVLDSDAKTRLGFLKKALGDVIPAPDRILVTDEDFEKLQIHEESDEDDSDSQRTKIHDALEDRAEAVLVQYDKEASGVSEAYRTAIEAKKEDVSQMLKRKPELKEQYKQAIKAIKDFHDPGMAWTIVEEYFGDRPVLRQNIAGILDGYVLELAEFVLIGQDKNFQGAYDVVDEFHSDAMGRIEMLTILDNLLITEAVSRMAGGDFNGAADLIEITSPNKYTDFMNALRSMAFEYAVDSVDAGDNDSANLVINQFFSGTNDIGKIKSSLSLE